MSIRKCKLFVMAVGFFAVFALNANRPRKTSRCPRRRRPLRWLSRFAQLPGTEPVAGLDVATAPGRSTAQQAQQPSSMMPQSGGFMRGLGTAVLGGFLGSMLFSGLAGPAASVVWVAVWAAVDSG